LYQFVGRVQAEVAILFENVPQSPNTTYLSTSTNKKFLLSAAFVYYPVVERIFSFIVAIYFSHITRKHFGSLNNQEVLRHVDKQLKQMYI
jgi:hypothetical protein